VVVLLLPTSSTMALTDEKPIDGHRCTTTTTSADSKKSTTIDPISLVKRVIKDIHTNQEKESPRSRFITRMIPVQTTCFANLEEISRTAKELIDSCFPLDAHHHLNQQRNSNSNKDTINNRQSFEILFKRRLCSSVTRNECIDAVARHFDDTRFKVDLTHPDYSFIMEVCKSLVCMSIVHNFKSSCHNFNLFQISEKVRDQLAVAKNCQDATTDDE
jgi:tRNA acetyltransferase TAN1